MLSMGAALGFEAKPGNMLLGVWFDNTGGRGNIGFRSGNPKYKHLVGTVRGVTVFKGSR